MNRLASIIKIFRAMVVGILTTAVFFDSTFAIASDSDVTSTNQPAIKLADEGRRLFLLNCAHCHGADARGDEGPDLHGVTKSDQRITKIIQNGIKGEMPKFSSKLNDADTRALIAYVRSLKN